MFAKPWPAMTKTSYRYSSVVFNCTTNDKDASVVLEHQVGGAWRNVIDLSSTFPNGSFIQRGQMIVLKKLLDSQAGLYRCIAKSRRQDEICLFFGSLFSARKKLLFLEVFVTFKSFYCSSYARHTVCFLFTKPSPAVHLHTTRTDFVLSQSVSLLDKPVKLTSSNIIYIRYTVIWQEIRSCGE